MKPIEIVIVPASNPGTYWPVVDGKRMTKATRQPFFDGARALLAIGAAIEAPLISRHQGSQTIVMQSTVGEAARWSVSESDGGGLRRQLWSPYENGRPSCAGNSSGDDDGGEGNFPAETASRVSDTALVNPAPISPERGERHRLPRGGITHGPGSPIVAEHSGPSDRRVPRFEGKRINPEMYGDGA